MYEGETKHEKSLKCRVENLDGMVDLDTRIKVDGKYLRRNVMRIALGIY
jgi:hypothetical protein